MFRVFLYLCFLYGYQSILHAAASSSSSAASSREIAAKVPVHDNDRLQSMEVFLEGLESGDQNANIFFQKMKEHFYLNASIFHPELQNLASSSTSEKIFVPPFLELSEKINSWVGNRAYLFLNNLKEKIQIDKEYDSKELNEILKLIRNFQYELATKIKERHVLYQLMRLELRKNKKNKKKL